MDEQTGDPEGSGRTPGPSPPDRQPMVPNHGEIAGLGLTMALATALFAWAGDALDGRLGTSPLFVLLGAFLGFGTGFYRMYARLVLHSRDAADGAAGGDDPRGVE